MVEHTKQDKTEHQAVTSAVEYSKPKGEVMIPALICGMVGAVLTTILSLIGRYEGLDQKLKNAYQTEPFFMQDSTALPLVWSWLLMLIVCFGISFSVLDTDKVWRRVLLFALAVIVLFMASPVLIMWDVFWSPFMVLVGLIWSWFCALIYSVQHTMPCETESLMTETDVTKLRMPVIDDEKEPELFEKKNTINAGEIDKEPKLVEKIEEVVTTEESAKLLPVKSGVKVDSSLNTDSAETMTQRTRQHYKDDIAVNARFDSE